MKYTVTLVRRRSPGRTAALVNVDEVDQIIKEAEQIPVTVIRTPSRGAALAGVLVPFALARLFAAGTTNWWTP